MSRSYLCQVVATHLVFGKGGTREIWYSADENDKAMASWPWHLPPSAIKANFVGLDKQEGPFLLLWPLQSIDLVHCIQNNTELNLHFTITFFS